jgi:ABC-type transporter Mla subunit MlaD
VRTKKSANGSQQMKLDPASSQQTAPRAVTSTQQEAKTRVTTHTMHITPARTKLSQSQESGRRVPMPEAIEKFAKLTDEQSAKILTLAEKIETVAAAISAQHEKIADLTRRMETVVDAINAQKAGVANLTQEIAAIASRNDKQSKKLVALTRTIFCMVVAISVAVAFQIWTTVT